MCTPFPRPPAPTLAGAAAVLRGQADQKPGAGGDAVASDGTPDAGQSPARPAHLVVDGWRGEAGHDYAAAAPGEVSLQELSGVAVRSLERRAGSAPS